MTGVGVETMPEQRPGRPCPWRRPDDSGDPSAFPNARREKSANAPKFGRNGHGGPAVARVGGGPPPVQRERRPPKTTGRRRGGCRSPSHAGLGPPRRPRQCPHARRTGASSGRQAVKPGRSARATSAGDRRAAWAEQRRARACCAACRVLRPGSSIRVLAQARRRRPGTNRAAAAASRAGSDGSGICSSWKPFTPRNIWCTGSVAPGESGANRTITGSVPLAVNS